MAGRLVEGETRRKPPRTDPPTRRQDGAKAFRKTLTEDQLHRAVAEYLDWILPPEVVWTTFPAGWGKLPKATAGRLKACGLKEGIPDILIWYNSSWVGISTCLGIELKVPGKSQTRDQRSMSARLRGVGVVIKTCHSVEEVGAVLTDLGVGVRKHWVNGRLVAKRHAPKPLAHPLTKESLQEKFEESPSKAQW